MAYGEFDPSSGVPLYRQIKEILRPEIIAGIVDPRIPITEVQLLDRFDVSRAPIRQALKELASEGYVYRKQGKGTFPVVGARVQRPAERDQGPCTSTSPIADCIRRAGHRHRAGGAARPDPGPSWGSSRRNGSCISPG